MRESFDRRIVPDAVVRLIRVCQAKAPSCHLAGGAGLGGAHLAHRLSGDVDLFCHEFEDVRGIVRQDTPVTSMEIRGSSGARWVEIRGAG